MSAEVSSVSDVLPPRPCVVDASVGVKWFLHEVHSESALRLLEPGHTLLVPDLLYSEIGNILWKRVRSGEMKQEEAAAVLQTLGAMPLHVHASWPLVLSALEIAVKTGRTVYDSLYLALAVREGAIMVTADEKFYNALKDGPLRPYLCWIEDI